MLHSFLPIFAILLTSGNPILAFGVLRDSTTTSSDVSSDYVVDTKGKQKETHSCVHSPPSLLYGFV